MRPSETTHRTKPGIALITLHGRRFEPYLSEERIQQTVQELAERIYEDYKDRVPIFIGVLNGAFMFVSDFLKAYPGDCELSFVRLSSYQGLSSTGIVETLIDAPDNIGGRDVVVLEDVIDSGRTVQRLVQMFADTNVRDLRIASLFLKPDAYQGEYAIHYVGMEIPNLFIVGYGLDYKELGRNFKEIYQLKQTSMINLVMFGKPGAGKGTQAAILKEKYGLKHISTGDVFRHNIKNGTPLGILAKSYIDKGDLVPDQVTIDMLKDEVEKAPDAAGFIFDGFPRTVAQAEALDELLASRAMQVDATIALEAEDEVLLERLLARGKESGRSDDQDSEKIRNRFEEYNQKTAPLREYYTRQGKFHSINGVGEIDEISAKLCAIVDSISSS